MTGKNGRPSSLVVSVPAATPTKLRFKGQTWFDRFGVRCGLACQVQTGDLDFDQAVYVRGPSREYAEQYLEDQAKREAVLAVLQQGFPEVRLTGTNVEAVWTGFNPKTNDRPGLTEEAAETLFILTAKLPWDGLEHISAQPDSSFATTAFLWMVAIAIAVTGIFSFIHPPVRVMNLFVAGLAAFMVGYPLFWPHGRRFAPRHHDFPRSLGLVDGLEYFVAGFWQLRRCGGSQRTRRRCADQRADGGYRRQAFHHGQRRVAFLLRHGVSLGLTWRLFSIRCFFGRVRSGHSWAVEAGSDHGPWAAWDRVGKGEAGAKVIRPHLLSGNGRWPKNPTILR